MEPKDKNKELADLRAKVAPSKVYEFIVPLDEEDEPKTVTFFLKRCDSKTEDMIHKQAKGSRERATIMGLKTLWLGGDPVESIVGNDLALRAAEKGLIDHMAPAQVEIKKN